jgi:hypothetical protein
MFRIPMEGTDDVYNGIYFCFCGKPISIFLCNLNRLPQAFIRQ